MEITFFLTLHVLCSLLIRDQVSVVVEVSLDQVEVVIDSMASVTKCVPWIQRFF